MVAMETEREPQDENTGGSEQGSSREEGERLPDPNMVDLTEDDFSTETSSGSEGNADGEEDLPPPNTVERGRDYEREDR